MIYSFDAYELDLQRYELRYAGKLVKLEPQVFNVLAYLVQHRDRVVTKQELLERLWPGRFVTEATLTSRLMAARKAIGDRGRGQRLIQTLHGRGYRFIAPVEERTPDAIRPETQRQASSPVQIGPEPTPLSTQHSILSTVPVVGRQAELAHLRGWLQKALDGTRQIVFVTGEAGLGKTTVVDAFIEEARDLGVQRIGRGQCIEHYGAGEAYMPLLEAWGQLSRGADGQVFVDVLMRQAPTWLVQLPWLVSDATHEVLQRRVQGATRQRMLREMAEAIEVLAAKCPLILVIDDLHWSDYATLDLVTLLAQRREPARFLLLGTYRPEAIRGSGHPLQGLMQELQLHQHCQELSLSALSAADVEAYLAVCLMNDALATSLSPTLHRRTEGNPLFMVNLLEHWMAQGWLYQQHGQWTLRSGWEAIAREIPATLRELVTQRQARLESTEQRLLDVASVSGLEFSAASIAAGLATEVIEAETWCEDLTRRGEFLQACGVDTWPDGTVATRYRFRHALYQDVVYERIPAARQVQIHRRIGTREEAGYGERCGEIAARLAMHFERGHDHAKAVRYHHQAAQQAMQRSGYQEAIGHLQRGLELLQQLPGSPERAPQELAMQMALGSALRATKAYGAPDVEQAYLRAHELCRQLGEPPEVFPVLYSLYELYEYLGAFQRSGELGEEILRLAQHRQDVTFFLGAYDARACTAFHLGAFAQVLDYTERGLSIYDPQHHRALASLYGKDLGASCQYWSAMALWFLGYPEQAQRRIDEALKLAREFDHPYTVALVHNRAAFVGQFLRQSQSTRQWAEVAMVMAVEHGFPRHAALAPILRGWALAMQGQGKEGIASIRQGLAAYRKLGMAMEDPYFLALLAEAQACGGLIEEGLATLGEALAALPSGRDFFYKAELYRLQGELLGRRSGSDDSQVEACFQQALEIAHRQHAKSLELRAAISLSRLWQRQDKCQAAHDLLAEVYGWFIEGFDAADLQEARALLEELRG
ncbi:MAG TPA: AAA family ATPase [Candidatus Tectomicrobia bacterium]|nr:AAA family ATPase [Candidatus Tectomicrobia bacterium]